MGVKITRNKETWTSEDNMTLVGGLIQVTSVTNSQTLKVGEKYTVEEVPDNGRNFGLQKLTKLEASTATFSKPQGR